MPWPAVTVRVLMIIGGLGGLLLAALIWFVAASLPSGNEFALEFMRGVEQEEGIDLSRGEAARIFGIVGLIPFAYAALSLLLAGLAGRRSRVVLWSIVAFQTVTAGLLILNLLGGSEFSAVLLFFALVMVVVMLTAGARAYYRKPSVQPGPWQAPSGPHAPLPWEKGDRRARRPG